ncbi:hypothetical protein NT6N_18010 [Oceaniferula spumae]|uniref:O-antigen ligase domain-containing protein n=1 Tax=Oceaniferula spumae TaxID=2979115 RepID=A0AAT9FL85_9BACT
MQNKINLIFVFLIALIFGIVLAVDIGFADYEQLGIYAVVGIVLYFLINGWRNVWWLTALLIFSGVVFYHSFEFNAEHLFVMMLALASLMFIISRGAMPQVPEFRKAGSTSAAIVTGVLFFYGLIHFIVYYAFPYSPTDYSVKTSTKAYFECYASMFCFFWLLVGPYGFNLKPNWSNRFIVIMVLCIAGNVAVRGALFLMGFQAADGLSDDGVGFGAVGVPIINMYPGVYTLRNISPLVCLILFMIMTGKGWWSSNSFRMKFLVISGFFLCIVGAAFSGGRASLPLCILLVMLGALMRRQVGLVALMGMAMVLLVAAVNIFSDLINTKAPFYVARSVQLVMIDKGSAYDTIGDSQSVRNAAIEEAVVQWKKDNRVFFFGRSVYHITWEEAFYVKSTLGHEGFVINAMKSGRTHNMITDLLLQYGIVGCVLYVTAYLMVIRFIWRLRKALSDNDGIVRWLIDAMAIYLPIMFIYQALGGTYMPIVVPLIIGLARGHLVALKNRVSTPLPSEETALTSSAADRLSS